jgi:hypothetical protein
MAAPRTQARRLLLLAAAATATGCTTFGAPRSARVTPGFSTSFQATVTTPVGDEAGWFWSFDCVSRCDHSIVAPEIAFSWGVLESGTIPADLTVGLSGTYPFFDGYFQIGQGSRPWGAGARVGSTGNWHEIQLYSRHDFPAGDNETVLWNPALFIITGNSPNGANPGSFFAFVQSVGIQARSDHFTAVPGLALVLGRGSRSSYGRDIGPFNAAFVTVSIRLTWHRTSPENE